MKSMQPTFAHKKLWAYLEIRSRMRSSSSCVFLRSTMSMLDIATLTAAYSWRSRLKKRIWQNDFGMQGMCDKGSVASVTRNRRPRAGSNHQLSLFRALSSSPLSEPSLKELHTCRPPYGLNPKARREYFWQLLPLQLQVLDSLVKKLSKTWSVGSLLNLLPSSILKDPSCRSPGVKSENSTYIENTNWNERPPSHVSRPRFPFVRSRQRSGPLKTGWKWWTKKRVLLQKKDL